MNSWRFPTRSISALAGLAVIGVLIFRNTLGDTATQIGNSDRLNYMLANVLFHVRGLRTGKLAFWDDTMLGGLNTFGLDFDVLSLFYSVLPEGRLIQLSALGALLITILSGWSAFYSLRSIGSSRLSAFVGAGLYQSSAFTAFEVMQHDFSSSVLVVIPLVMVQIRSIGRTRLWIPFAVIAVTLWFMMAFLFLQIVSYSVLLFGAFAIYLSVLRREWGFIIVYVAAGMVAFLGSLPRLWTVVQELTVLSRSGSGVDNTNFAELFDFQNIRFVELFRLLDDGIFGRFPSEAASMGNNINLTEGMQLHTSVVALLIICGSVFYRNSVRTKEVLTNYHSVFMATVFLFSLSVIVFWPSRYLIYLLYLKSDFTHGRVATVALFPFVVLVAAAVDRCLGKTPVRIISRTKLEVLGIVVIAAAVVLLTNRISSMSSVGRSFAHLAIPSHVLDPPWLWFTADPPAEPAGVSAVRQRPDLARLSWQPVSGAAAYLIELSVNGGPTTQIAFAPAAARFYDLASLDPAATYGLRLAACNVRGCSGALDVPLPAQTGASAGVRSRLPPPAPTIPPPDNHFGDSHLRINTEAFVRTLILSGVAIFLLTVGGLYPRHIRAIAGLLGMIAVFDASVAADFQINGPQNLWMGPAFQGGNMMTAAAREFRSPSEASIKAAAQRLETTAYRSVAVCSPSEFATFCAPHLGHFWNFRLLDGYTAGLPRGLAAVPWPEGIREMRSLTFRDANALPWHLLALFNVKYAIMVSRLLYSNGDQQQKPDPANIPILENPFPVVPRVFFTGAVMPVPDPETAIARISSGSDGLDPQQTSYAVGLAAAATYDVRGHIDAAFMSDRVDVHLEPDAAARFLVLNEQPHPGWHATADGQEARVYSVNGAMRGLVVPAGVTTVTFSFRPFALSAGALPFIIGSVGFLIVGIVGFRRHERLSYRPA